jgi:hypothetical protein
MNKKTIYIIVAVLVVIIIIAGAAVYILGIGGIGGQPTPTPTPTPTPVTVVGATSLQFTVDETTSGAFVTYNYAVRNFNASNEEIRVDIPGGSAGNYSYIIKLSDSTSFLSLDNGVTWTASTFATDENYATLLNDYVTNLYSWNGQDATYTYASGSITNVISAIQVNPTLADSLFATS